MGVEGLEWGGFGVGVCGWGLRVPDGGLGRFNISLPFLPTFHFCHFYRATFTCAFFTVSLLLGHFYTKSYLFYEKKIQENNLICSG